MHTEVDAIERQQPAGKTYRIIPSRFPPIGIFEDLVDADELEILFAIEALTNDRLRAEAGDLNLVPKEEWVTGPGATVVMAAFTHTGHASRFSDGSFGVYYAALDEETAIRETVFHQQRRLRETNEDAIDIEMRCYIGRVLVPLDDIRNQTFSGLQDPDINTWPDAQAFASQQRNLGSDGLWFRSARHTNGECIAAFRPKAISRPQQGQHYIYKWSGEAIHQVSVVSSVITL